MFTSIINAVFTTALVLTTPVTPVNAQEIPIPVVVLSDRDKVSRIADELGFDREIVFAVIDSETGGTWDCTLIGKAGEEGCFQIIRKYHPDVEPLDIEDSTRYFIEQYRLGNEWMWTSCSCMSTARVLGAKLPKGDAKDLKPNSDYPTVGGVVVFKYGHVAYIEKVTAEGIYVREGNFDKCRITRRIVKWNDTEVSGYYYQEPTTSG